MTYSICCVKAPYANATAHNLYLLKKHKTVCVKVDS